MQTFLPDPNYGISAGYLDDKRLGKQRVETKQLIMALNGVTSHARNHPACIMWEGCIEQLAWYGVCIAAEWMKRGFRDTTMPYFDAIAVSGSKKPVWLGMQVFHDSHKSNLLRKDPTFYGQYNWNVPHDLPYFWPSKELK